jgi:hypothetical protein
MVGSIVISYTSQDGSNTLYSVTLDQFSGEDLPRSFANSFEFSNSANGAAILAGPSIQQKRIWAISCPLEKEDVEIIYNMFNAWDADRATGKPVGCSIVDTTFIETVSTTATFSTSPTFTKMGGYGFLVDFGLTEI